MPTSARDNILRRLRSASPQYSVDLAGKPEHSPPRNTKRAELSLLDELIRKLITNQIEVRATTADQQQLIDELSDQGLRNWITGTSSGCQAFTEKLRKHRDLKLTQFSQPIEDLKVQLFDQIDIGLSSACCAIAETGTLILQTGPEEPRTLSLVPPVHVVLLNPAKLFRCLDDYLDSLSNEELRASSNLLLISSPSKTADIQQTLAYGAHGPKRVIVLFEHD